MKGNFVFKFLSELITVVGEIGTGLARIPYKGFRYSDFGIYGNTSRRTYLGFKNLEHRGIIANKGKDSFVFTPKGRRWLSSSLRRHFLKRSGGGWDKKWRIVIFDIPQELHRERVKLRSNLKSLGLVMLQRSVFVFPFPCEEEVGDVCERLGVSDYVDVLIAESVGSREKEFRAIFNLD